MVFENVFAGVANQLLGSYIENIDSKDMSLGLGGTDKFNIVTSNVWHFEVKTMVKFSFRFHGSASPAQPQPIRAAGLLSLVRSTPGLTFGLGLPL